MKRTSSLTQQKLSGFTVKPSPATRVEPPYEYQMSGIKFMVSRGAAGLLYDPGLGKTRCALTAFKVLKEKGLVHRALIISPLRPMYLTWPAEINKWKLDLSWSILHGNKKAEALDNADVHLINPEGLDWLSKMNVNGDYDMLIVDESSKFKNTRAQRFKILRRMLKHFKRRYILTGSPVPNGLLDIFGQIYILDLGAALGEYITHFKLNYFYPVGFDGYKWALQPGAEQKIYDQVGPLVLRMSIEEHKNLPPKIPVTIEIELDEKTKKLYKTLKEDLIIELQGKQITAVNVAVATQKLRQVANGGIYADPEGDEHVTGARKVLHIHDHKTQALIDLVDELEGQPLLVGYEFHHDLARLKKAFPDAPTFESVGDMKKLGKIQDDWNAGNTTILLAQIAAAAHGLNLQEGPGHAVCYYSLTWNLEDYEQFFKRVWRPGQKKSVMIYHITAKGTVDATIMLALKRKAKGQSDLFKALKDTIHDEF